MDYFGGAKRARNAWQQYVSDFSKQVKAEGKTFNLQDASKAWRAAGNLPKEKPATACRKVAQASCRSTQANGKNCVWVTPKRVGKKSGKAVAPHCRASPQFGPRGPTGPLRPLSL